MTSYKITLPGQVPGPLQGPARVQALLPEREPVLQALPQVPGPVLRALPGPEPGLPALQLPRVSAPQPSYNQRLQRIMPQRKPPK